MKKTLSLFILISLFLSSKSQIYVYKKNINADSSIRYFEITHDAQPALFFITSVDFGQRSIFKDDICDSNGKRVKFHSGMDLVNYITSNGWKLIKRDMVANGGRNNTTVFLLFERE